MGFTSSHLGGGEPRSAGGRPRRGLAKKGPLRGPTFWPNYFKRTDSFAICPAKEVTNVFKSVMVDKLEYLPVLDAVLGEDNTEAVV